MGLKYRNMSIFHDFGMLAYKSLTISSMNNFVRPYGMVALNLASSLNGKVSGWPYTVALLENTNRRTDFSLRRLSKFVVPPTLTS